MKNNLILLLVLFSVQSIFAQVGMIDTEKIMLQNIYIAKMMQQQSHVVNVMNKTDGFTTARRVVSQSKHDDMLTRLVDSVKVSYSGESSSTYDYNAMVYAYNYPYNTSPLFGFNGIFTKPQIQFDRYTHWQINPNTLVYGFYQKDYASYDASKNLLRDTAVFADSLVFPNMLHLNNYTAANKIESSYSFKYSGGVADSAFKQYFVYDGSNKLVKDSMYQFHAGAWYVVSRSLYTYDGSNNLTLINNYSNVSDTTFLIPLIEQLQYSNTYDASNRLTTVQTSFYDGTLFRAYVRDTFEYTALSTFHSGWREHQYDRINSRWEPTSNMIKTLNVDGLPDTINAKTYDRIAGLWVPFTKYICKYDSFNNPTQLREYQYNFSSFPATADFTTYYFYETYTVDTGNGNIGIESLKSDLIKVFPNPTNGTVFIDGIDLNKVIIHLTIMDVSGRIYREQELINNAGKASFSMYDMIPGTYLIKLSDEKGQFVKQQLLIKE